MSNPDFPCLPVKLLFHDGYYDGPLTGVCEYKGEKLYFHNAEEIWFRFPEKNKETIAITNEEYDYHSLRIYTLYRLPEDIMFNIVHNHELFELVKHSPNWENAYNIQKKPIPDYFKTWKDFTEVAWKYAIGYTTDDIWDNKEWLVKRHG
jgi:hypothetical protein